MEKIKILLIINPKSGTLKKAEVEKKAHKILDKNKFALDVYYTKFAGDAKNAAREAAQNGVEIVIAAGGDGTVNEIASQLINTQTAMAILPLGSGNGLARHLSIPHVVEHALELINKMPMQKMDAVMLNNMPFFNVSGMGFDAYVGYIFATLPARGFKSYVKASIRAFFNFKPFDVAISSGDKKHFSGKCYMVSMANSSQFGNNCYINPLADVSDGKIEIAVITPFPRIFVPFLVARLFMKTIHKSKYIKTFSLAQVSISAAEPVKLHLDGEVEKAVKTVNINVLQEAVKVIAP